MNEIKQKKWFFITAGLTFLGLLLIVAAMVIVDPYFHYHDRLDGLSYRLYSERYMNHGIVSNFEYDAIITGSSMNQNFKTSKMDELFGTNSIKVPFSGAGFQEIKNHLDVALTSGNRVEYVLWGLDYNGILREHYWKGYSEYPDYLYDNSILNDVSYVFNKNLIFEGLITNLLLTLSGEKGTSFDEYSSWEVGSGWEQISNTYRRSASVKPMKKAEEWELYRAKENIQENIINLVNRYPDTTFLFFYTPYSALYWESLYRDGVLERQLEMEKLATEMLLECKNVRLFNFVKETEITTNVNNYRDKEHYVAAVNDLILSWISEGKGLVTKENYKDTLEWTREFYNEYDYDTLYIGYEQYKEPESF